MSATDDLLQRHAATLGGEEPGDASAVPALGVAVVTCMDTRISVFDILDLRRGEVHVLRNGGGVATDDMIRSLAISQRELQTREVMVVQHTTCGMTTITEDSFKDELERDTGLRPAWSVEAFRDVESSVRQSVARVRRNPFVPHTDRVRGFVYDVRDGKLSEVA